MSDCQHCQQWIEAAVAHQRRADGAEHDLAAARAEIATLTAERDGARTDMTRLQEVIGTAAKDMVDAKAEIAALRSRVTQIEPIVEAATKLQVLVLAPESGEGIVSLDSFYPLRTLLLERKAALSPSEERESGDVTDPLSLRAMADRLLLVAAKVGFAGMPDESDELQAIEIALLAWANEKADGCHHNEAVYVAEHDNYYCVKCDAGMGDAYYAVSKRAEKAENEKAEMERQRDDADSVVAHLVIDREWLRKTDDPEIAAWADAAIARHNARHHRPSRLPPAGG